LNISKIVVALVLPASLWSLSMARHLRVEYPGALYHVTARGNDRGEIFRTVEDRRHLLELIGEGLERYEVDLYAWILLNNHYHLVAQTEHPNLNRFMHYIHTAYTVWMNKRNRRTGHLFEGPYKAVVMEESGYLLTVSGYVHLNPVRMRGWRDRPTQERLERVRTYPWSSYAAYTRAGKARGPEVSCDRVWGELGARNATEGRRRYREYIRGWLEKEAEERQKPKRKRDEAMLNPLSEVRLGCFLGGDGFRDFVQGLIGKDRELSQEMVGRKEWRRETPMADLLCAIVEVRGVSLEVLGERRWHHAERDLAMYLCREAGEKPLREIGESFGIGAAAVSHAIGRVRRGMAGSRTMRREVARPRDAISKIFKT